MQKKKINDITHLLACKRFLKNHVGEKNGIAHLQACKLFFLFMQEKKKNDITFVGLHVVFKKFTWVKKKNDIAHLQGLKWLFLLT
jgi:hypothetical protein